MKRLSFVIFLLSTTSFLSLAQDIYNSKETVTWLGIDFSELKLLKSDELISEQDLQGKYFPGWNELVLQEPKKFDIQKAVGHDVVENSIDAVTKVNEHAKGPFIITKADQSKGLEEATIKQMVKKMDLKGKSGIGLLFIAESMDKVKKEASFWVTFIDMENKTVLLSKRMVGESGGFGFRNYWAGSINKVLKALPAQMKKWNKG